MRMVAVLGVTLALAGCGKRREAAAVTAGPAMGSIADGDGVSRPTAYAGHLVFSRREGDRYRLLHWHDGRTAELSPPPQGHPFDADVGPDEHGRPVVVYTERGSIMQLRLDAAGRPMAIGVSGASNPSRWRGRLAYARGREVLVRLRGKRAPRRLARVHDVEALDLGARAVALTANHSSRDLGETEWTLQVVPLDGERPKVMVRGYVSGACGFVRPIDPTAHGKGAFWVATGAACDTTRTIFAEADLHYRRPRSARDGKRLILGATRDATATYWLRADAKARVEVPYPTVCEDVGCTIMRVAHPRWRARAPGRPFGPHPEG